MLGLFKSSLSEVWSASIHGNTGYWVRSLYVQPVYSRMVKDKRGGVRKGRGRKEGGKVGGVGREGGRGGEGREGGGEGGTEGG